MNSKKNKKIKVVDIATFEKEAEQLYKQEKYRQAREIYKELVKTDKDKYFHRLVSCYMLHAEQLVMKGMVSEADEIYKHIELLTGHSVQRASPNISNQSFFKVSSIESTVITLVNQESSKIQKCTAADTLVLGFSPVDQLKEHDELLYNHLGIIYTALESVCNSEFDKVNELLQQVPSTSPFSHWRLFIKGLSAYYAGNEQKAISSFQKIPSYSLISSVAESFLALYNENTVQKDINKNTTLLKSLSYLSGNSAFKDQLARAQYLQGSGRIFDAYFYLQEKISTFPSLSDPFLMDLSNLFLQNKNFLQDDKHQRYHERLLERFFKTAPKNECEVFLIVRLKMLIDDFSGIEDTAKSMAFLASKIFKDDFLAEAAVYKYLAILAKQQIISRYHGKSSESLVLLAENALKIDPHDSETWAFLITLFRENGKKTVLGKTVDRMLKFFPEDLTALKTAATIYLEKEDYSKASKTLKQLHELNQFDYEIRNMYAFALIKESLKISLSKNKQKAGPLIERALVVASDDKTCLSSKPYVVACMALIYIKMGDSQNAQSSLTEARLLLGSLYADFYIQCLSSAYSSATDLQGLHLEFNEEVKQLREFSEIHKIWKFYLRLRDEYRLMISSEQKTLESATEIIFGNSIPHVTDLRNFYLLYEKIPRLSQKFKLKISKLALKYYSSDLFFRLIKMENIVRMSNAERKKVEKIVSEARASNDAVVVKRGEELLSENQPYAMPDFSDLFPGNTDEMDELLREIMNGGDPFDLFPKKRR